MTRTESIEKLRELIKGMRTCMMTTIDEEGSPHSRPMATQEAAKDGTLSFLTSKGSRTAREIAQEQIVNLSYADDGAARYVSITGRATLRSDRAKIHELWSPLFAAWWPAGKDDPDIALLEVSIDRAEYWDSPAGKVVQLLGIVKAALTGREQQRSEREHGEVDLH